MGRHSHYTPIPGLNTISHYGPPGSNSFTQFEMPSQNVISKSRPRAGKVFGKSVVEKQELRRANRGGKSGCNNKKKLELEVEDMEVTVKKNNLTQHQSTFDSELLSESTSPEKKELDIDDNKMEVDEDSEATQPLDTQPNDGAEFHFDEDDEVEKNDVYNNRGGGIDEDEDDTDVDSDVDENASVESELGSRRLFPKSTVKKKKNNSSNRRVIKDEDDESEEEDDDVDMDVVHTKKQKKKSTKGKFTNPRKKTSGAKDDDTSDEETDYEQDGKENSTAAKRGVNTNDTTSGKRRSERLKSNKPINLDESRFSEEDSENELDTEDEDITYSRRVKGDKKRGGGKSSKHGKLLCLSMCC